MRRLPCLLQLLLALAAVALVASASHVTAASQAQPTAKKKAVKKAKKKKRKPVRRASAPVAAPPKDFYGLTDWATPSVDALQRQASLGFRSWRVVLDHGAVSSQPGTQQFTYFDNLVAAAAEHGITFTFTLTGCPVWSCPDGRPPTSGAALQDWLAFVTAAVQRYGQNGSFWATHPSLPAHPVTAWQVYNEINGADQWPDPDPAAYAAFLNATSQGIRAAEPASQIIVGGLGEKMTVWMKNYLAGLYAQPGFAQSFDVMAIEGYAVRPGDIAGILDQARTIMNRAGDAAKPIWMTEMSWATGGPTFPFNVPEAQQASYLKSAWSMLGACRSRWNLQRVFWFGYQDKAVPDGGTDYWGYHNGLVRLDGSPKPALAQADAFARGTGPSRCTLPTATAARKKTRKTVRKRTTAKAATHAVAARP